MLHITATPTGGPGQPLTPRAERRSQSGCSWAAHLDPQRAGECPCNDLAADRDERRASAAMDAAGPCGLESDQCDAVAERAERSGAAYACPTHLAYVRSRPRRTR